MRRLCFVLWGVAAAVLVVGLGLCGPLQAHAGAIYEARQQGVVITVFSEPCAVAEVSNLPKRATWSEGGALFEGCAGATPFGVLAFYFRQDRSVAVVPVEAFVRLVSS